MKTYPLERRNAVRVPTYVSGKMGISSGSNGGLSVQIVDVSTCGAGLLTPFFQSPMLGQTVDLEWKMPGEHPSIEPKERAEQGVVVNLRPVGRHVARMGIRFLQQAALGAGVPTGHPMLCHRQGMPVTDSDDPGSMNFPLRFAERSRDGLGRILTGLKRAVVA